MIEFAIAALTFFIVCFIIFLSIFVIAIKLKLIPATQNITDTIDRIFTW